MQTKCRFYPWPSRRAPLRALLSRMHSCCIASAAITVAGVCGCSADDASLPDELARQLIEACPLAEPNDLDAREACAKKLTDLPVLQTAMMEPFRWGQQQPAGGYDLDTQPNTRFNPYVWRALYLPLFMWK